MITVLRIPVSKDRLRAMPADERALLILLGYVANQINLLSKLVIFPSNKTPDGIEQALSGALTTVFRSCRRRSHGDGWGESLCLYCSRDSLEAYGMLPNLK
jgi:hypothetical protein